MVFGQCRTGKAGRSDHPSAHQAPHSRIVGNEVWVRIALNTLLCTSIYIYIYVCILVWCRVGFGVEVTTLRL